VVEKTNKGTGSVCGDIRHGTGKTQEYQPDCDGEVTEGNKDLPEITPPDNLATLNSNCRLAATCSPKTDVDPYVKSNGKESRTSTNPWNASTRTINIGSNSTLTMGGKDPYFVCRLMIDNGELIMAAGAKVQIFFDTPEHCGMSNGAVRIEIKGNGKIVSSGYQPQEGKYDVPGLFLLGSANIQTNVNLAGNAGVNEFVLYGPHVDIDIGGTADWVGMMAGKSLHLHGNGTIKSDPGISPPGITYSSLWERTRYVECVGPSATPPNGNC
jgi:hypothetical protein